MRRSTRGVVVDCAELTDPGRDPAKQVNEDAVGFAATEQGLLAVVCDGMGGHMGGREASHAAVGAILETAGAPPAEVNTPEELLKLSVERAALRVWQVGGDAPMEARPGSTCVALLIHERGAEVAHVGDSRAYLIRKGTIQQLTRDHSVVQSMLDAGLLTAEQAADHPDANRITRALGMQPEVEVETAPQPVTLLPNDTLLLCSDGLTDLVDDHEILGQVQANVASGLAVVAQQLVSLANDRGGHDNITVQLVHVVETPARSAPEPTVSGATTELPTVDSGPTTKLMGDDADEAPPATVALEPDGARNTMPDASPGPTIADERGGPGHTLLGEPAGDATTSADLPPGPSPIVARTPGRAGVSHGARLAIYAAVGFVSVLVIAILLWWGILAFRRGSDAESEPIAAPEPTEPVPVPTASSTATTTLLIPEPPPPAPPPAVTPDASASGQPTDASIPPGSSL